MLMSSFPTAPTTDSRSDPGCFAPGFFSKQVNQGQTWCSSNTNLDFNLLCKIEFFNDLDYVPVEIFRLGEPEMAKEDIINHLKE